jgi:polyisoprenyl-teichoic acid--peptidoglycan teichoic acid transferase
VTAALRAGRLVLRLLPALVLLAVVVPGSAVQPATLSLTKVETADGYDAGADVVWVLILGAEDDPDKEADTDAIELLGIDSRTGSAVAIGIPRDTYVEIDGEKGRINGAFAEGGPQLAARAVEGLVGFAPTYVLVSKGPGFVDMVDALGGVTVDSPLEFVTDPGNLEVSKGPNDFTGQQALYFAQTRQFDEPRAGDFIRVENHQALLLGLLAELQEREGEKGFVEAMALRAIDGIDTDDASPLDLYRLLNALTSVDPTKTDGCPLLGDDKLLPDGNMVIVPDTGLAQRLGREARDDATFESGCDP